MLFFPLKDVPLSQLKEKDNSLRIISAVIESMKYWRAQVQRTVLLFEILGRYNISRVLQ